jgi:hypothetical protein
MIALCGKNVQLFKLGLVVHKVTTGIERIYLRAVGIRRTRNIAARGNLINHFNLAPRLRMSGVVMQLFHTPSWLAQEQLYIFVKL